jgi:type IV pilus assembly protein PilM
MLSVSRALGRPGQTSIVLDIGGRATDIGIIKNGQLALSRSVPTAGYAFTRAVAQGVGISEIQAEEYKKTYGLDQTQLEGKVGSALAPVFKVITDEVRKAIHYYQGESGGDLPTSLILIGAGAGLPGVVSTLSKSLNFEVSIGNPFQNIAIDKTVVGNVESYAPLYTQAIGLALRFD